MIPGESKPLRARMMSCVYTFEAYSYLNLVFEITCHVYCRYPYNLDFNYGPLEGLQKFCINNLGDPFIESNYGVHSREFEVHSRSSLCCPCSIAFHFNSDRAMGGKKLLQPVLC